MVIRPIGDRALARALKRLKNAVLLVLRDSDAVVFDGDTRWLWIGLLAFLKM